MTALIALILILAIFGGLGFAVHALWYVLIAVSTGIFAWGVVRLVLRYRRGQISAPPEGLGRRVARAASIVLTHRWIKRRDPVAGIGHALIFYGFLVLFAGTTILAFQHLETFRSRFAAYPVTVRMLSRFVAQPDQERTLWRICLEGSYALADARKIRLWGSCH